MTGKRRPTPREVVIHQVESTASEHEELRVRFERKDIDGTLAFAEEILRTRPADVEALYYAKACRGRLALRTSTKAYEFAPQQVLPPTQAPPKPKTDPAALAIFGTASLKQIPAVRIAADKLLARGLDHKAGFLLSLIDGTSSVEVILDLCAMPRDEAFKVLHALVQDGIVLLR